MQQPFRPGEIVLGKYRIEHVLGQGGMGIVVAARHEHLGELFAIKFLLPEALANPEALERFLREARASARLKGEHVARVQDVGKLENGAPYMVMEHLDGHDLKQVLKQRGPLPIDEVALFVYQACEAVAEAHGINIVHRDLKPANLFLIKRANGTPCVKVLDFGLARDLDAAKVMGSDLTTTGTFMGSPRYMAPEQMRKSKAADVRSDIWSLGVILYELATGRLPFHGDSLTELVSEVLTSEPDRPSEVRPSISPAFEAIVMRCLEKQPDARYQTARDLMAALRPFLSTDVEAVAARPALVTGAITTPDPMEPDANDAKTVALPDGIGSDSTLPAPAELLPAQLPASVAKSIANTKSSDASGGAWGNTSKTTTPGPGVPMKAIVALLGFVVFGMITFMVASRKTEKDAPIEIPAVTTQQPTTPTTTQTAAALPLPPKTAEEPLAAPSAAALSSASPTTTTSAAAPPGNKSPTGTNPGPTTTTTTKNKPSDLTLY